RSHVSIVVGRLRAEEHARADRVDVGRGWLADDLRARRERRDPLRQPAAGRSAEGRQAAHERAGDENLPGARSTKITVRTACSMNARPMTSTNPSSTLVWMLQ